MTREAVDRARGGGGPTLIEVKTFRMRGHAEHDDAFYVPKELIATWEARDPIRCLADYLESRGLMDEAERQEVHQTVSREIDEAVQWAEQSPMPDPATQAQGVYADPLDPSPAPTVYRL